LQVLREASGERELLAKDLLINVTHFFRDPAAFDLLGEQIIPELVQRQTLDRPLRVWVPGCSTGEEAYSITMLFLEQIAAAKRNIKLQVFASDIDADCVAFARNGIYPESIEADVAPTRLARFFTKEDHSYQVVRELREAWSSPVRACWPTHRSPASISSPAAICSSTWIRRRSAKSYRFFTLRCTRRSALSRVLRNRGQRFGSLRADQQEASHLPAHRSQPAGRGRIPRGPRLQVAFSQTRPTQQATLGGSASVSCRSERCSKPMRQPPS
jgi:hypothetical protein